MGKGISDRAGEGDPNNYTLALIREGTVVRCAAWIMERNGKQT